VGSYTHGIALPPEREQELPQVLSLMSDLGYIRMEEVGGIPRLPTTPSAIVYAPLGQAPVDPDVVLVSGRPGRMMLLHEAAARCATSVTPMLGRPTCMAIPAAMSGSLASSLGCAGNRVYTGVSDDEFYVAIPGPSLSGIVEQLSTIVLANAALTDYHISRRANPRDRVGTLSAASAFWSVTPSTRSTRFTVRVSAGCDVFRCDAAATKLPYSASVTTVSSSRARRSGW
jgi:hypothetical protein